MIEQSCQECGRHFFVKPYRLRKAQGKFCSLKCRSQSKITKVERICLQCGNTFLASPSRVRYGKAKFCSLKCRAVALGIAKRGNPLLKRRERRVEQKCLICGITFTTHISRVKYGFGKFCSRKCFGKALAEKWRTPEYVTMMMKKMAVKPTKPERRLQEILDKHFTGKYKYTGDGKLIINGMRPDFANCNGKKDLIEVFGDYWHSPKVTDAHWERTELGKIMTYGSLGYRCLVIWESELTQLSEDAIVDKIKTFARGKR